MTPLISDQSLILVILLLTVALFLWGRWRHDMVAAASLLACVVTGLLPAGQAFSGFGHPAVISVACVLVLSRGLQSSGAVDVLTRYALPKNAGAMVSMAALIGLGAVLSGFMNNVGAMALLMPVAIQLSKRLGIAPGQVLMPLAFGTILGGMTTLIGTPPNLIVAGFRAESGLGSFGMFDFTPIGLTVAVAGVGFVVLVGWRLVPARKQSGMEGFETGAYLTEARVQPGSKAEGQSLRQLDRAMDSAGAQVVGLVRNEVRMFAPNPNRKVREGDILAIEADAESLAEVLSSFGLKLEEAQRPATADAVDAADTGADPGSRPVADSATADAGSTVSAAGGRAATAVSGGVGGGERPDANGSGAGVGQSGHQLEEQAKDQAKEQAKDQAEDQADDKTNAQAEIVLMELAVLPGSLLDGRSASDIRLRTFYGLNLLALSRQGQRSMARLRAMAILPGDLLLMQGSPESIAEFAAAHGCVPLAERALRIPNPRKALLSAAIMVGAVALAALGLLPAAVSFALGVLVSMVVRTVPPRAVYDAIDWPVIVLLAALIPVAGAMETTGAADLIARFFLDNVAQGNAVVGLALILVVTMFLSDLMNNAATAAVMCPIALGTAAALQVSPDAFLMAVAIGASCAFLTPIGHQNNTLILGPGGFRFGDYWRLGLPLEVLVAAVGIPMLLLIWPL